MPDGGNRAGSLAGVFRPSTAAPSGSAASLRPFSWPVRLLLQPQILAEMPEAEFVMAEAGSGLVRLLQRDHSSTHFAVSLGCQINQYSSRRTSGTVNGTRASSHTNWMSDVPIGEWEGVATDRNGSVVELELSDNQMLKVNATSLITPHYKDSALLARGVLQYSPPLCVILLQASSRISPTPSYVGKLVTHSQSDRRLRPRYITPVALADPAASTLVHAVLAASRRAPV